MTKIRCVNCGAHFIPAPQVPHQTYCSKLECQKERRRQWHKSKLQSDPDYRENQSRAQKAWTERNPDYWRQHRQARIDWENSQPSEPNLTTRNPGNSPANQNQLSKPPILQKALQDGVFRLKVLAEPDEVKMDAWIVELSIIHAGSGPISRRVKR